MKEIAPQVYVSTEYPGVNVGFVVTPKGVIAFDAPTLPHDAHAWRAAILETAALPILYVVLTDTHPDRLLSAGILSNRGESPLVAARAACDRALTYTDGLWRSVIENWARRFPHAASDLSDLPGALPEITFTSSLTLHKGGLDVTIRQVAGASPGSAWVYLPEQDVLFAGDTVVVGTPPLMANAPDTKAWLDTLVALRRPRYAHTVVVPGRGPVCDAAATRSLSEYITLARRRVRSLHGAGQSRTDTATLITELAAFFPPAPGEDPELIQRRVKAGLDRLYEELKEE